MTEASLLTALDSPVVDPGARPNPLPKRDMSIGFDFPLTNHDVSSRQGLEKLAAKVVRGRANEYKYDKLEVSNNIQIRILRLEDDPILCRLIPSSLSSPYEALSYV